MKKQEIINAAQALCDMVQKLDDAPQYYNGKYADGVYVLVNDRINGEVKQLLLSFPPTGEDAVGVVVVYHGRAFQVALKDLGERPLVRDTDNCPEESPFYKTECEGLHDWDFIATTEHIKELGTDIPLPDGWYIPTLAVLEVMCFYKEDINKVLIACGGEPMPDDYHWSSTEYSRNLARSVNFNTGNAFSNLKYYGYVVRPVAAFTLEP